MVAKLAEEREEANWCFRSFLKGIVLENEELDTIVHKHYENVARQNDCCACGNCSICPISINVCERLKAELWHRPEDVWEEGWE